MSTPPAAAPPRPTPDHPFTPALTRLGVSLALGLVAGFACASFHLKQIDILVAWDVAAIVFLTWTGAGIARLDEDQVEAVASREDSGPLVTDTVLLSAATVSLIAVGYALVQAGAAHGADKAWLAGLGVLSVVLSWAVVHLLFALRYARVYFNGPGPNGGISFNQDGYRPTYTDFLYLALTVGMTYQVSDTNLTTRELRATALHHALLSFVFGTVVIASAINLIANLGAK